MGIQIREAISEEMKKNIRTVQQMTKVKGVKFKKVRLGNTKALISEYGQTNNKNIIIYIHGGGFVSRSASSSKGYSSMLAKYSGYRVIAVDYALAPEYAFPKAFDDCYDAFEEIVNLYPDAKITLVGENAGANLCLALALKTKEMKKVSCVLAHSPIIDFTGSLDRKEHDVDDFTVKEGCLKPLNEIYVGKNKANNPYISPLFGDYNGFPPTFITCDYNETLYADSKALYTKCEQEGVDVELVEVKGTFHAFATIGTGTPETRQILEENIAFMNKYL